MQAWSQRLSDCMGGAFVPSKSLAGTIPTIIVMERGPKRARRITNLSELVAALSSHYSQTLIKTYVLDDLSMTQQAQASCSCL